MILDLNLPGLGGIELLRRMSPWGEGGSWCSACMPSRCTPSRALDAGAAGYVSKNVSPDELLDRRAARRRRGRYVENEIAQALALRRRRPGAFGQLSARELEIMRLLGQGGRLAEIAEALGVGYKTVANTLQPDEVQARRLAHRGPGAAGDRDRGLVGPLEIQGWLRAGLEHQTLQAAGRCPRRLQIELDRLPVPRQQAAALTCQGRTQDQPQLIKQSGYQERLDKADAAAALDCLSGAALQAATSAPEGRRRADASLASPGSSGISRRHISGHAVDEAREGLDPGVGPKG